MDISSQPAGVSGGRVSWPGWAASRAAVVIACLRNEQGQTSKQPPALLVPAQCSPVSGCLPQAPCSSSAACIPSLEINHKAGHIRACWTPLAVGRQSVEPVKLSGCTTWKGMSGQE